MEIGKYSVYRLDTGRFRLDGGAMFGVVPKVLWEKKHPADEKNRIHMALNTLLIVGEGRVVLVDTGIGDKWNEKLASIYGVDHSRFSLMKALLEHNIQPEDVTDVILTHLHFDHVGGATYYDESGELKLRFPEATHYVQKSQLEWSQKRFEKDRASYLQENIEPLVNSGKLRVLDGPATVAPGIELLVTGGHTPGQQLTLVSGDDKKLLYAADLIPLHSHVAIPWVMAYDLYPVTTIREKKEILARAAEENWMIFFEHDPEIYCATVVMGKKGYEIREKILL